MENNNYIVVADDNNFFASVIRSELVAKGFEVEIAGNGKIAYELIETRKPILLLLDLIMPVQDGFETLKKIKSNENLKDIKVVIFSNLSQSKDIEEVNRLGADGYITKQDGSIEDTVNNIVKFV